jgi:predicted nucleic acid-binding protein
LILVDSSVWIDCFRGTATPQAERLDALLGSELLIIGDLILTEMLQGFGSQRDFDQARKLLTGLDAVDICGQDMQYRRRVTTARCASVTSRSARQ